MCSGQYDLLKFILSIRMKTKGHLSDFEWSMLLLTNRLVWIFQKLGCIEIFKHKHPTQVLISKREKYPVSSSNLGFFYGVFFLLFDIQMAGVNSMNARSNSAFCQSSGWWWCNKSDAVMSVQTTLLNLVRIPFVLSERNKKERQIVFSMALIVFWVMLDA